MDFRFNFMVNFSRWLKRGLPVSHFNSLALAVILAFILFIPFSQNFVYAQKDMNSDQPPGTAEQNVTFSSRVFGTFNATTPEALQDWKASGGTAINLELYWDRLQKEPYGALDPVEVANVNDQITQAKKAGLNISLSVAVQYPPQWVKDSVPGFKDQFGNVWQGGIGEDVRDWIWSNTGRNYLKDFITKSLGAVDLQQISYVRLGGGYYNELHYPRNRGIYPDTTNISYWGFGSAPQGGTDLAPDQKRAPLPGYVPFTGSVSQDATWTTWYLNSLKTFEVALIDMHRQAGWNGPIFVLHPGYFIRSNFKTSDFSYRIELAEGDDVGFMIDGYKDMPGVWPGTTWVDGKDTGSDLTIDSNLAPWRKLKKEAALRGKDANLYGENTGGGTNANMDDVFKGPAANGYNVLFWLDYPGLASGDTGNLSNLKNNINDILTRNPVPELLNPLPGSPYPVTISNPLPYSMISMGSAALHNPVSTTITLGNDGNLPLTFSKPILTGDNAADFRVISPDTDFIINPNSPFQAVTVECTPSRIGARTATLHLTSNDPSLPGFSYELACSGLEGRFFFTVSSNSDNGFGLGTDTLSYALLHATAGQDIILAPGTGASINLTAALPPVPQGVNLVGSCSGGKPAIIINGAGIISDLVKPGIKLSGQSTLMGIKVTGFNGSNIFSEGAGNHLICFASEKLQD
jgi:hypothetical protein